MSTVIILIFVMMVRQDGIEDRMTKKEALERPPLLYMFEDILTGDHALFQDSKNWEECKYSCHVDWLKPLLDDGLIEETGEKRPAWPEKDLADGRKQFFYHDYKVTPAGLKWWPPQYTSKITDRPMSYKKLIEERNGVTPQIEGKGIGAELSYYFFWGEALIALAGIEDGYFEFVSFYNYSRSMGMDKRVRVRLTKSGYAFFTSIPRLVLECA